MLRHITICFHYCHPRWSFLSWSEVSLSDLHLRCPPFPSHSLNPAITFLLMLLISISIFCSLNYNEICVLHWTLPMLVTEGHGYFRVCPDLHKLLYFCISVHDRKVPPNSSIWWQHEETHFDALASLSVQTSSMTRLPYLSPRIQGLLGKMCEF